MDCAGLWQMEDTWEHGEEKWQFREKCFGQNEKGPSFSWTFKENIQFRLNWENLKTYGAAFWCDVTCLKLLFLFGSVKELSSFT